MKCYMSCATTCTADEVQEYVTPGFIAEQSMDINAQREYVLLMEKNIQDTVQSLSRVEELSHVLNSDNIRKLQGKGADRMQDMQLKQLSQLVRMVGLYTKYINEQILLLYTETGRRCFNGNCWFGGHLQ